MFRVSLRYLFASKGRKQYDRKVINKMADKIEAMKTTMEKITPRSFSVLFILTSVPSFWFSYQLLASEYSDPEYLNHSNHSLKWFYVKNLVCFACGMALTRMRFTNPSSQFTVEQKGVYGKYWPLLLTMLGLILPPFDSKFIVWPVLLTELSTVVVEVQLANQGILPFWFYSFRHWIRFFDLSILVINYYALKRYRKRMNTHPHEFAEAIC